MTREGGPGPPLLWGLHASMSRAVGTMCRLCGDFINSSGHHCISSPCRHLMALVTSHNEDGKRGSAGRNLTVVRLHCKSRLIHTHKKNIFLDKICCHLDTCLHAQTKFRTGWGPTGTKGHQILNTITITAWKVNPH